MKEIEAIKSLKGIIEETAIGCCSEDTKAVEMAIEALEKQKAIKATGYKIEEIIARNIIAWETSKDKSQGLLPEVYLTDRELFRQLTGLEPNICNLKKYVN